MDGRDALLAVGMNGQPLPVAHGFPARMVVPGLYGYTSATKWVTRLTVTTFATQRAYWTQRGYAAVAPIRSEQAGVGEGDGGTQDDSNGGVAPGQFCEESGHPRHWLGELRVVNDGRQGPVEVAEDPAVAGSRRSGASGSPVSRATA